MNIFYEQIPLVTFYLLFLCIVTFFITRYMVLKLHCEEEANHIVSGTSIYQAIKRIYHELYGDFGIAHLGLFGGMLLRTSLQKCLFVIVTWLQVF